MKLRAPLNAELFDCSAIYIFTNSGMGVIIKKGKNIKL